MVLSGPPSSPESPRSLVAIKVKLDIEATVRNDLSSSVFSLSVVSHYIQWLITTGILDYEANRGWESLRELSSGGSEVIDLHDFAGLDIGAGAGDDAVGLPLILEEIVLIMIVNLTTSEGDLEIEPDSSNGWAPIGTHNAANGGAIGPGGMLMKANPGIMGFDVVDGSEHRLLLSAVGGDVDYKILILGRNDDEESSSSASSASSESSSENSSSSWSSESSSLNSSSSSSESSSESSASSESSSESSSLNSSSSSSASDSLSSSSSELSSSSSASGPPPPP